jgi:hypothetical protein
MEADSKRSESGSKEEVDVRERRRERDLGSARGKRIFCRESRASRASWRGRAPLQRYMFSSKHLK